MLQQGKRFFTSESVTEGHPDKVCDQISDAVLDAILEKDPQARVACETTVTTGIISIMGVIAVKNTGLALILLLMQRKRVLLLDEPFCGLDAESVFVVQQLILQLGCEGRTLLVAADSLALLDGICDDLYVLGGGQVQGRYEHYEFRRAIREAGSAAGFPKK